jgi:ABC-type multidrug transport system ATPase subunit
MTQRLALCRVLLHDPALLILDEPYTALDDAGAELLDRELASLRDGRALLVSTHDPARVEPLATARLALAPA